MSAIVNISCDRGDTAGWTLTVKRDDDVFDLTGCRLVMAVRLSYTSGVLFERSSDAGGGIVLDDQTTATGQAEIKLQEADTLQLPNSTQTLVYSIHVHTGAGDQWCAVRGALTVNPIGALDADL